MKKKIVHGKECHIIENLQDIFVLNKGRKINFVCEYDGYYYMAFYPEHVNDEVVYKIDETTLAAEVTGYVEYLMIENKAKSIPPIEFYKLVA